MSHLNYGSSKLTLTMTLCSVDDLQRGVSGLLETSFEFRFLGTGLRRAVVAELMACYSDQLVQTSGGTGGAVEKVLRPLPPCSQNMRPGIEMGLGPYLMLLAARSRP